MEDPENFEYLYTELTINSQNKTHAEYCDEIIEADITLNDRCVVVRQEIYPKLPCIFPFDLLDIVFLYLYKPHEIEQEWAGCDECGTIKDCFIKVIKKRRLKKHHAHMMIKRKKVDLPYYINNQLYNNDGGIKSFVNYPKLYQHRRDGIKYVVYYPVYHQKM